jgi:hypothetical protein
LYDADDDDDAEGRVSLRASLRTLRGYFRRLHPEIKAYVLQVGCTDCVRETTRLTNVLLLLSLSLFFTHTRTQKAALTTAITALTQHKLTAIVGIFPAMFAKQKRKKALGSLTTHRSAWRVSL